jgi:hypothetical protein
MQLSGMDSLPSNDQSHEDRAAHLPNAALCPHRDTERRRIGNRFHSVCKECGADLGVIPPQPPDGGEIGHEERGDPAHLRRQHPNRSGEKKDGRAVEAIATSANFAATQLRTLPMPAPSKSTRAAVGWRRVLR